MANTNLNLPYRSQIDYTNAAQDSVANVKSPGYFNSLAPQLKAGYRIFDLYNNALFKVVSASAPVSVVQIFGDAASGPLVLPGVFAYFDAEPKNINAGSPNDGVGVASWADLSNNNYTMTQATAINQPLWRQNAILGLPAVEFTGGSCGMNNSTPIIAQPMTVYLLARYKALIANAPLYDASGSARSLMRLTGAAPFQFQIFSGALAGTIAADTNWHVFTTVHNGAASSIQIDMHGAFSGGYQTGLAPGPAGIQNITLGFQSILNSGSQSLIAKAAFCSGAHTPEQQLPIISNFMAAAGLR